MKTKRIVAIVVLFALALTCIFAACDKKQNLTDEPLKGEIVADFTKGQSESVFESDGWANGSVFNVVWDKANVTYGEDAMHLGIKQEERTVYVDDVETTFPYTAGEARTTLNYGYGDFEVSMKPAKKAGTASTFFTCTGNYDTGLDGQPQKHDEIDIEFLGKDTTKVQFNYFVNGVGGHEYMYKLGFDASKEYHTYGYRWTKDYIVWFVDGKPVYKVEASATNPLPSAPGRVLMNYWCGTKNAEGWMGKYSVGNETADYQWVKTSATGVDLNPKQEDPDIIDSKDIPTEGWVDIDYSSFGGWNGYEIDKTNGLTISHETAMDGWKCEGMSLASSYSWVKFTVKNNAEIAAKMRIDVKKEGGAGGVVGVYCADEGVISLDTQEAAATVELEAGQTAAVVLKIKDMTVDQFVVFLNSMQAAGGVATGSVTITELKGVVNGDPSQGDDPDPDVKDPESGDLTLEVNGAELEFKGNVADGYGVNANDTDKTLNVTYNKIAGASYKNIWAAASSIAREHNVFTVKITNNGTAAVTVRIDIESETNKGNTTACNLSATQDGQEVYTDLEWGGSTFTVAAGATVTAVVTYDAAAKPTNVKFFFDSSVYDDKEIHSGDVTLSELAFSGEVSTEPDDDHECENPCEDCGKCKTEECEHEACQAKCKCSFGILSANSSEVTFKSDGSAYEITQDEGAIKVAYNNISGKGYTTIAANIANIIADNNVLTITIKNNGANVAKVRLDVVGNVGAVYGGKNAYVNLNASYTGDVEDQGNDYSYGGADWVKIAAGGTVTCKITFEVNVGAYALQLFIDSSTWDDDGTHTGEIVLSDMSLTKEEQQLGEKFEATSEEIINSGKGDDSRKDDAWMLWWVQGDNWGCGTVVTMQEGWNTYDGGVNFTYSGGNKNFSVQLFYNNTAMQQNKQYVLKCTIEASEAMDITVNGKPVSLTEGSNEISVQFTLGTPTGDGSPMYGVDIQFWGVDHEVTFGVKDVEWTEVL